MPEQLPEHLEQIIGALSPYLSSCLNSFGELNHGEEHEDMLQEIRLRIWNAYRSKGDNIQYLNAYVKKVVLSVFINEIGRLKKENRLLIVAKNNTSRDEGAGRIEPFSNDQLKKALLSSLETLKEAKRRVIKLRLEGFSFVEIARLNKWTLAKAHGNYYRGIKELKHTLRKEGILHED